jgi:hypothetical protein
MNSPKTEQEICVNCGFCCDGTLFNHAVLEPGEKGQLPEKMKAGYFKTKTGEFFRLPCSYFSGKCTIYDQKKAHVCSSFRCKLLKDFSKNRVTQSEAIEIVQNAMDLREEIRRLHQAVFDTQQVLPFREILINIGDLEESQELELGNNKDFKLLKIKATILETLLIRHFKSKKEFDKMIENT